MTAPASARSAARPRKRLPSAYDPPWKRVLQRYLKPSRLKMPLSSGLWVVYRRMGWTDSKAYWKTRSSRLKESERVRELRPTELALMATIIQAPVGEFMEAVARETGIPEPVEYETSVRIRIAKSSRTRARNAINEHKARLHPVRARRRQAVHRLIRRSARGNRKPDQPSGP